MRLGRRSSPFTGAMIAMGAFVVLAPFGFTSRTRGILEVRGPMVRNSASMKFNGSSATG